VNDNAREFVEKYYKENLNTERDKRIKVKIQKSKENKTRQHKKKNWFLLFLDHHIALFISHSECYHLLCSHLTDRATIGSPVLEREVVIGVLLEQQ